MLLAVTAAVALFYCSINRNFVSLDSLKNIMYSMSATGTLSVGIAMLLIGGQVDLAAGAEACFGGLIVTLLIESGVPWPLALAVTVAYGLAAGAVNAFFVNYLHFMSFIATIGLSNIYLGLVRVITAGKNLPISDKDYWVIGSATLFGVFPLPFVIMAVLMGVYGFILTFTGFGRDCYMCGGNNRAARLCGLDPGKITTLLFINNGAIAAIAGAVLASRMHNASPQAFQTGALDAITASILGGVSFMGGAGGMSGCFIGLLLLTVFTNGLTTSGLPSYWQVVAQGALLVAALCVDFFNERSRRKALEASAP
jgi:ribose/xylose/arabinose/galactoside ABC-type transport system permease subunit